MKSPTSRKKGNETTSGARRREPRTSVLPSDRPARSDEAAAEGPDGDRELLSALLALEAEIVAGYTVAARSARGVLVRQAFASFRDEHAAHVGALNVQLGRAEAGSGRRRGAEDERPGVLGGLARIAARGGDEALLLALMANEELTNIAYGNAVELVEGESLRELLERHQAEEKRHLSWLEMMGRKVLGGGEAMAGDDEDETEAAEDALSDLVEESVWAR